MTTHAKVEDDWMRMRVKITLAELSETHATLYDFAGVTCYTEPRDQAQSGVTFEPLSIPEGMARALYEELARHFGGHPETASLRKDYEHERSRVDKFISHLTQL